MSWLNPTDAQPTGYDPEANVLEFIREFGQVGSIALEAWNRTDLFHCLYGCNPDEYLGYAKRFAEAAARVARSEWSDHPDLVEELVRRSFYPTQIVNHTGLGHPWVTAEDIKSISRLITEEVERLGGMEKLLPKS